MAQICLDRVRGFRDHPLIRTIRSSAAVRELLVLAAGYLFYTLARLVADDDVERARQHAAAIVSLEHHLGLGFELSLNAGLTHLPFVIELAASFWYASLHYLVTPAALFLLWRRRPELYVRGRWVLVLSTVVALCIYLTFPVAPPRLMGGGFTDVMFDTSRWGWWGADASAPRGLGVTTNELAAMPSMHVGWAVWSAWALSQVTEHRWMRCVVWAYPVVTALVVIATGNHWVLDVVVGAAIVTGVLAWLGESEPEPHSEPESGLEPSPQPKQVIRLTSGDEVIDLTVGENAATDLTTGQADAITLSSADGVVIDLTATDGSSIDITHPSSG